MAKRRDKGTMTELLRQALSDTDQSIRGIARKTGLSHPGLLKFMRGDQSLRLDLADRLAEHFGIECRRIGKRER